MDNIYNSKCIRLDEYKIKKSNKRKFNKDKTDDLDLIEELYLKDINNGEIAKILNMNDVGVDKEVNKIKFEGMKVVANVMDKIFKSF